MQIKTKLIISQSYNPYENLALEEYLLEHVQGGEVVLYLWQNQNTIVIGKNQNPWKECRVSIVEKDGVSVARRLSGGGAVFHDLGNLNFTFIMKQVLYNLEKQLQVIINAMKDLGINAAFTGKNDITVEGKKFSGNAFYFDGVSAYHHGTILVDTNMNALEKYLQISKEKMQSKGIDSVKSRVVNLVDLNQEVTIDGVSQALVHSFERVYGNQVEILDYPKPQELEGKITKHSSWEWLFSQTPKFNIKFEKRFEFGNIELLFSLKNSMIQEVVIYSDAVMTNVLDQIKKVLVGIKFNVEAISQTLSLISVETAAEEDMVLRIQEWLAVKEF